MGDVGVKTGQGKFGQRVEVGRHVLTVDEDGAAAV